MSRPIRSISKFFLSIEEEDGKYLVVHAGKVAYSTRVLAAAKVQFDEILERLTASSREFRARENAHFNIQAVRSDSYERRTGKSRKQGGRGGRGGV